MRGRATLVLVAAPGLSYFHSQAFYLHYNKTISIRAVSPDNDFTVREKKS